MLRRVTFAIRSCKCWDLTWPVLSLNCRNSPYNMCNVLRGTAQQLFFLKSDLGDYLKLF